MIEFIAWFLILVCLVKWFDGWLRATFVTLYLLGSVLVFLA